MWPMYKSGEILKCEIYSEPQAATQMVEGEVYLTRDASEWVVHRCVCEGDQHLLKGDWSPVTHEAPVVWGKVVDSISPRCKKWISHFSKKSLCPQAWRRYSSKILLLLTVIWAQLSSAMT